MNKTKAVIVLAALLAPTRMVTAQEGGGTTGADFLLSPPATRLDAMGGALDGLGLDLDGAMVNPAVVAGLQDLSIQVHFVPMPSEVTHAQAAIGIPLLGGMGLISADLFNSGSFTDISDTGQPGTTVNVFDIAGGLGYSRYLGKTLSLGVNVKGIYRSLGYSSAFAVAGDLGFALRFRTPHIGQPPRPPTRRALERDYEREKAVVDREHVKRVEEATRRTAALQKEIDTATQAVTSLEQQLAAAEAAKTAPAPEGAPPQTAEGAAAADAKIADLQSRKTAAVARLEELRTSMTEAQADEAGTLAETETWYATELAAVQTRYDSKVADLSWVESERARLFEVIWNAEKELTEGDVDDNVDDIISKTRAYAEERQTALREANAEADQRDRAYMDGLRAEMAGYQTQIDEEVGTSRTRIQGELDSLRARKAEIEATRTEENKDQVTQQSNQVQAQIVIKERELEAVLADAWVKRLGDRIKAREGEIADLESGILLRADRAEETVTEITNQAEADIRRFEELRETIQRDLKKAKLKRELDTLEARNDRVREKAQSDYKVTEERLYTQLLSTMYRHQELIFRSRLAALTQDASLRRAQSAEEIAKARETADDNLAFQQRFLGRQIADEERKVQEAKSAGGQADETRLEELRADLEAAVAARTSALSELDTREATFAADEKRRVAQENDAIRYERQKMRLVYLQQEDPYRNTSLAVGVRNLGTNVRFPSASYPMPIVASASLGYALIHLEDHRLSLAVQVDVPVYDAITVGLGLEYAFAETIFIRGGYAFGSIERTFSAGIGLRLGLGFTTYAVDYAFRPLPDWGFLHSLGVSIQF